MSDYLERRLEERAELEESRPRSSGVFEHLDRVSEYVAILEADRDRRASEHLEEIGRAREHLNLLIRELMSTTRELEETRGALEISEDRRRATLEAGRARIQHYSSELTEERLTRRITESRLEAELTEARGALGLTRDRVSDLKSECKELRRELTARELEADRASMRGDS